MQLLLFFITAAINFYIALRKGFNPWLWVLAAGLLGLIVILILPSAEAEGINDETSEKRRITGNNTGLGISVACLLILVLLYLFGLGII